MSSDELAAGWRGRLDEAVRKIQALAGPLSDRQVGWNSPGGGWSIGEVLDHLAQTNEEYLPLIRSSIAKGKSPARREWKPSLFGGLLARGMQSPRKMPAPRAFRPAGAVSERPLERFAMSVRALGNELTRASRVDLRTRVRSPASRLIPLNLGDSFLLQVLHAERHLQQMRRVRDHAGFPT